MTIAAALIIAGFVVVIGLGMALEVLDRQSAEETEAHRRALLRELNRRERR